MAELVGPGLALEVVGRLDEALRRLERGGIDAVLLDLSLPDGRGLETLDRLRAAQPRLPVVILTALDDERLGVAAVRHGAQDYLVKGSVGGPLLARALRYAIERERQLHETAAEQARHLEADRRERRSYERIAGPVEPPPPLRTTRPDHFTTLVERYGRVLDRAVEQRQAGRDADLSVALHEVAEELARRDAGPADVIDLHTAVLTTRAADVAPLRAQLVAEEGRLLVLELMGRLALVYRGLAAPPGRA